MWVSFYIDEIQSFELEHCGQNLNVIYYLSLCQRWLRTHIYDRLLLTPLHPPHDTLPPPLSLIALIVPPLSSLFARDLGDMYLVFEVS